MFRRIDDDDIRVSPNPAPPFWGYIANRTAAFSETNEASVGQSIRPAAMPWVNNRGRVATISEKPESRPRGSSPVSRRV